MEHVVFFPAPDGSPAFRRFGSLDDAVRFVEHLRNTEGVAEVSVHTLAPVPLAFRAYYKVEVPSDEAPVSAPAPEAAPEAVPVDAVPVEAVAVETEVPVAYDAPAVESVESVEAAPAVEAAPVEAVPFEPVLAEAAVTVTPSSPNGKRSLGFFAH